MSLLIGTSGWSYDEWVGPFYERKQGMFTRYTQVFATTEINSTFYSYPTERLVTGWTRTAPRGFIFSAKLPQLITHDKWLRLEEGVEDDLWRFIHLMQPLGDKLGPILVQLRPKFEYERHAGDLERFLELLPKNHEWVVEFRHPSWMRGETYRMLEKHNAAYAIVDEPLLPAETHVTADHAYIRWHGHGKRVWYDYEYSEGQIEGWVPKVKEVQQKAKKTYGYFNNHFNASAVKNAVELLQSLGSATEEQVKVRDRIIGSREEAPRPRGAQSLDAFRDQGEDGLSVSDLLIRWTDGVRLARAEAMEDEVRVTRLTPTLVEARIKDYSISIDLDKRVASHDCDDWRKNTGAKKMCKHVDRLFLVLPPGEARRILTEMWLHRDEWSFEA